MTTSVQYETVIGLETHVQLSTLSKMFCACPVDYQGADPNTRLCAVCLGLPGSLPVINNRAVEYAIAAGLALNCEIATRTKFDRKNYAYPDLMKGYQISQYDMPIAYGGHLVVETNGARSVIGITRVHMEEDVAKLTHASMGGDGHSLVDVNRSGVPLLEIVSEPDIRSPEEARQYLTSLRAILQYLGITTGNMEEGSFRCDANVSVRPVGSSELSVRAEVKNMNSFRAVYSALCYEVERQIAVVEAGGTVVQETRGWNDERGVTVSQRSKEHAHDYRYFPEPDLPELAPSPAWVEAIRTDAPELPAARRERFMTTLGLSEYDANLLTVAKPMADFFDAVVGDGADADAPRRAKSAANWLLGDVTRLLNADGVGIEESRLAPEHLRQLLSLTDSGVLSSRLAKTTLEEAYRSGRLPQRIVEEDGLAQIQDSDVLEAAVAEAVDANPKAVNDYLSGKETAVKFLVGQVMRLTRGKANPAMANELVKKRLDGIELERWSG